MNEEEDNSGYYFSDLVKTCEAIRNTQGKNKKIDIIANYISKLNQDSLRIAVLFLSGKVFPRGSPYNLNIGFRTILQSLFEISNLNNKDIKRIHLQTGDIGAIAEYAISKKHVLTLFNHLENMKEEKLALKDIHNQFKKISSLHGSHSSNDKKNLLKGLLLMCSPLEAKYLIKIITNELRIGSYEGLVEMAIAKAFDKEIKNVREAILVSGNIANVAVLSKENSLDSATIDPFVPMSFMLADVMFSSSEIIEYFKKPLFGEYKYDGIRVQLHKFGDKCKLFSRNLADISYAFPEVIEDATQIKVIPNDKDKEEDKEDANPKEEFLLKNKNDKYKQSIKDNTDFILDGEWIAFKNNKPLHFQELQKRLGKKTSKDDIVNEIPVCYIVYDIMFFEKDQVINRTLEHRKKILSKFMLKNSCIDIAQSDILISAKEIENKFRESRSKGHEGLVIKDPLSRYHPGKRGRYWIKLKEELDTIDAVIVMAEYGHGKRAGTLSDYTLAVKDFEDTLSLREDSDSIFSGNLYPFKNLKIIGKAYSGLSNKEIDEMTKELKSLTIEDKGNRIIVEPKIILEVSFDTVQKSNRHGSGYALRFPRIKNIRYDKDSKDIDSLDKIKSIYENQFHVKNTKNF
ncbi:MAG: ATP-dependent DNA ligase [Candidatus Nitrosocosmicus sp.]